ncbi:bifunctional adenosylcobinamide kinase/adenosylcobinamide-phosphate guanylyltransferase [Paenibacillus athensensis]|uniref:Adenosylcobinamide kinase n=1 Tax=Paenibacillus athensensis TaxID=1967502 RepID=A0A4Y8PT27_9BACL|nr:bifunctional adenosylcobinamide kinase/adenosylcobinamide-phosphate guanylyltransferase [Paenibacillus athensensis]MCD1262012.1 bifunctional adenosylcobinamide kinase/adenosylcobinamide-phosphate guanylyltransferase [Paenibacillus athensensis]
MPILVTGGARSGKSAFAEKLAKRRSQRGMYIATSQIYDEEMRERVEAHRSQRMAADFAWQTLEEPYELADLLGRLSGETGGDAVLVDCLTLWLSNCLLRVEREPASELLVTAQIDALVAAAAAFDGKLILVTNEVGSGIVPEYLLGRRFRDLAGRLNQRMAAVCDEVFLVTAGIPVELKRLAYRMDEARD